MQRPQPGSVIFIRAEMWVSQVYGCATLGSVVHGRTRSESGVYCYCVSHLYNKPGAGRLKGARFALLALGAYHLY